MATETPRPWRIGTFRALRHPNYRLYFIGQCVSLVGSWMQATALAWLVHEWTGTSSWPALMAAATIAPMTLFSVWGGSLADRLPRRPLIAAAQSALLLLSAALAAQALFGLRDLGLMLGLSFLIGVAIAFDTPARLAFIGDISGKEDLANAVALNAMAFNAARLVGPAVAGLLLADLGAGFVLALNAASFLVFLAGLALMDLPAPPEPKEKKEAGPGALAHLGAWPGLVVLLVLAGGMSFMGWPLVSLLPAFATGIGAEERGFGLLMSAIGAGALLGTLVVATAAGRARLWLLGSGVTLASLGLGLLSSAKGLGPSLACCALAGLGMILFFSTGQTALQLGSDEGNRGGIMGVWLTVLAAAHPLGHLTAGTLADRYGVRMVLAWQAAGVACLAALAGLAAWRWAGRVDADRPAG
ncbi:MAG: MFS transporter [Gemmataceae bacterium]|nr:MFS transporter [Gemmataceae bacterium]